MLCFKNALISLKTLNLRKGQRTKQKEPDPGGWDQQNLGFKKLKNRKTDRTVGLNFCISNISSGTAWLLQGMNNWRKNNQDKGNKIQLKNNRWNKTNG